jgi:hypothetical protein
MPRYYFHFRSDHGTALDDQGTDFPDLSTAREQALASARELLADAIRAGDHDGPQRVVIADASGRELATVSMKDVLPRFLR